jgi:hypothetical protein
MLAISATALLRLARLTQALGRHPAPGQMPQAIGGYIRLLLLMQATACASRHTGLVPAAVLILLVPAAAHLGKRFYAS